MPERVFRYHHKIRRYRVEKLSQIAIRIVAHFVRDVILKSIISKVEVTMMCECCREEQAMSEAGLCIVCLTSIRPVLYLKREEGGYYVGETINMGNRYSGYNLLDIVAIAPASSITKERKEQELEAIEFCMAFGLPLTNVHKGNARRAYAAFLKSGEDSIINFFRHWSTNPDNEFREIYEQRNYWGSN